MNILANHRPMRHALALLLLAWAAAPSRAADAPRVSALDPSGACRGTSVEVVALGKFPNWPPSVHVERPGIEVVAAEDEGHFSVAVAADATPGIHFLRFFDANGAASPRPFLIGTLPETMESEPNDTIDQAQPIDGPSCVVNGRLAKRGDVDAFAVALRAGETLVASVEAHHRLGAPMDGILQVVSPEGFVVDHADDAPLLDPRLAFTASTDGTYIIRLFCFPSEPNSSIQFDGGDEHVYRLTLTTGGLADLAHPLAVPRDGSNSQSVGLAGWNLPDTPCEATLADGPGPFAFAWSPEVAGAPEVLRVDRPAVVASGSEPAPFQAPAILCGQLLTSESPAIFPFEATKGEALSFRVDARSLGAPIDAVLRVLGPDGKPLAEADDARKDADPVLSFEPPVDGTYRLEVRDLFGRAGPRYVFRVDARPEAPDFDLGLDRDHFEFTPGEPSEIKVDVDRSHGHDRPITVEALGLPEGITAAPAVSEPEGDTAKAVTLRLEGPDAPPCSGPFRIAGRVEDGPEHPATAELIGGFTTDAPWLTVRPRAED